MQVEDGETVDSVVKRELRRIADTYGGTMTSMGSGCLFGHFLVCWKWRASRPDTVLFFACWPDGQTGQERETADLAYTDGAWHAEGWPE